MFKKSKNKLSPPPAPPTVDEMLADIDTFNIVNRQKTVKKSSNDLELPAQGNVPLDVWWEQFDEFEVALQSLIATDCTIDKCKQKLDTCKTEIEIETKQLQENIKQNQLAIKATLE